MYADTADSLVFRMYCTLHMESHEQINRKKTKARWKYMNKLGLLEWPSINEMDDLDVNESV